MVSEPTIEAEHDLNSSYNQDLSFGIDQVQEDQTINASVEPLSTVEPSPVVTSGFVISVSVETAMTVEPGVDLEIDRTINASVEALCG